MPYDGENEHGCYAKIKQGVHPLEDMLERRREKCQLIEENQLLKEILLLCFRFNFNERPTASIVL